MLLMEWLSFSGFKLHLILQYSSKVVSAGLEIIKMYK